MGGGNLLPPPPLLSPSLSSSKKKAIEWVPLQNHPVFTATTRTTTPPPPPSYGGNLAAWDPSSSRLYLWDPCSLRLHRLLLRFPDPADSSSTTTSIEASSPSDILAPDAPIRSPVRHVSLNRDGSSLLLLSDADALTVVHLHGGGGGGGGNTLRTSPVGGPDTLSGRAGGLRVLQASWHPFSEKHLGVLSSDSVFRLYDLTSDLEQPEQEFYLQPVESGSSLNAGSICPVAFSFGGQHLWDRFSVHARMRSIDFHVLWS